MITPKTAAIAAKTAGAFREYDESPAPADPAGMTGGPETAGGAEGWP
jgi:hypothetical protein